MSILWIYALAIVLYVFFCGCIIMYTEKECGKSRRRRDR